MCVCVCVFVTCQTNLPGMAGTKQMNPSGWFDALQSQCLPSRAGGCLPALFISPICRCCFFPFFLLICFSIPFLHLESEPLDSWDAEEDSILTPEDEEMELDDVEADGETAPKVSKKKPPKVEESRSKKEHVNVVFIGHVGKCNGWRRGRKPISLFFTRSAFI